MTPPDDNRVSDSNLVAGGPGKTVARAASNIAASSPTPALLMRPTEASFAYNLTNGSLIASLNLVFGVGTVFTVFGGNADGVLSLSGSTILRSATPLVPGGAYTIVIKATHPTDATAYVIERLTFTATIAAPAPGFPTDLVSGGGAASVPSQVTGIVATPGVGTITLAFSAPAANGSAITDYIYQYRLWFEAAWTTLVDGVSATPGQIITGLVTGQDYQVRVYARNSVGDSIASATSTVTTIVSSVMPRSDLLYERFSAQSLTPQADGTDVLSLTGSIAGLVGTGVAGATAGKYKVGVSPNGKPAIRFSTTQKLDFGRPAGLLSALGANDCALVIIGRNYTTASGTYGCPVGVPANAGSPTGMFNPVLTQTGVGYTNTQTPGSRLPGFDPAGFMVYVIVKNNTDSRGRIYLNGSPVDPGTNNMPSGSGSGNWCIGGGGGFGSAFDFQDAILLTGGVVGACDVLNITKWAYAEYGETRPWATAVDWWAWTGDSTVAGTGGSKGYSMPHWVVNNYTRPLGTWGNVACPGTKMYDAANADMTDTAARDLDSITAITGLPVKLFVYEFTNRYTNNATTNRTEDYNFLDARVAAQPSIKILFGDSISLRSETSDGVTLTSAGTNRVAYNASMLSNWTTYQAHGATALLQLSLDPNLGVINANPFAAGVGAQSLPYWQDDLHPYSNSGAGPNGYTNFASLVGPAMAAM